jgi:ABC-2 type transport system ATP-binding protein
MSENNLAIEISDLAKTFQLGPWHKPHVALRNVNLTVPTGQVYGYLGPNGAGKTTTLKILFGLVRLQRGAIRVLGRAHTDPAWRARVGYLPEHPYLQDVLTPVEYLLYVARLAGVSPRRVQKDVSAALDRVGLLAVRNRPMRTFSKGMIQRAAIAQALVGEPELLVLDEPMSGLDPLGRAMVRRLISDLRDEGRTVFFSTHILSDAESLCDRVAILRDGEVVSEGPLSEVLRIEVDRLDVTCEGILPAALDGLEGVSIRLSAGSQLHAHVAEQAFPGLVQRVSSHGGRILTVLPVRRSLEEVFLNKVQGEASWEA